jgi:hypothetical protein
MDITPKLIDDWKYQLAVMVDNLRRGDSEAGRKKADHLEGFYSVLTCFQRAAGWPEK